MVLTTLRTQTLFAVITVRVSGHLFTGTITWLARDMCVLGRGRLLITWCFSSSHLHYM